MYDAYHLLQLPGHLTEIFFRNMPESFPFKPFAGTALLSLLLSTFILSFSSQSSAQAQAQELRRMEVERVASNRVAVFQNYHEFAAVMIESSIPGLQIDSNLEIVADLSEPASGVYRVIVHPYRQTLYLRAPGYMEARVNTGVIQARQVIEFTAEPQARSRNLISVIFNVQPEDAVILVDGERIFSGETNSLPAGSREVRIEREGYRSVDDVVEVSDRNILFSYSMDQVRQELVRIITDPPGAEIRVDNVREGISDHRGVFEMFRFPEEYFLTISADGYLPVQTAIEVSEDDINEFQFALQINSGRLRLTLNPTDAIVRVNRQEVTLYNGELLLPPGLHSIDVSREHYDSYTENLRIEIGEVISRQISLTPHTGSLQIIVLPSDAQVRLIDDKGEVKQMWVGSRTLGELLAGNYIIELSANGYDTKNESVVINRSEDIGLRLEMIGNNSTVEGNISGTAASPDLRFRDLETVVVEVVSLRTSRIWMDRNLGALHAAESPTDSDAFGDLYQWGRGADGHQKRSSFNRSILSETDNPNSGSFILSTRRHSNWRVSNSGNLWQGVNGVNNPCPTGFRLPTRAEWQQEQPSHGIDDANTAYDSPLKLTLAGMRNGFDGRIQRDARIGYYWTSSISGTEAQYFEINYRQNELGSISRASGLSVRCIKDLNQKNVQTN
ncbi:MAG: hypothetical protein JJU35_14585 [Balneolales bacterium]|nr:hypothetical protein [Balneolales bacterium]